jgi:acylphosphatase
MATAARTVHVRIEGRVQGVGYRAWAQRAAMTLRLAGWVRNRIDGSVEAVFQGSSEGIEDMLTLCERGPPGAAVDNVEIVGEGVGTFQGFEVRTTA